MAQDELTRTLADRALRCADPARPTPRDIHAMETGGYHIPADEEPDIQPDTGRSTSCPDARFESSAEDAIRTEDAFDPGPAINPKDLVGSTKLGLDLLPPGALCELARVMALGAKKYGPYNWRDYPIQSRIYLGAMLRHLLQHSDGQDVDPESGALHLAHLAAGALILIDAMQQGTAVDTRPKSVGVVNKILEESRNVDHS